MKKIIFVLALPIFTLHLKAQDNSEANLEEIVVTSSFVDQIASEVENPIHVVGEDEIQNDATQNLGEVINNFLGVSMADYGAGVGQPVIRGMTGSRIKVLNNGVMVRDISGLGGDHVNDIDLSDAQQIEIVRGPSSLLYANGSIGGIINVVDYSIPRELLHERTLKLSAEVQSVSDARGLSFAYRNSYNNINFTYAFNHIAQGDYNVPDYIEEEHGDEEHHDEDHENQIINLIHNSDVERTSHKIGFSNIFDDGYFGLSISNLSSLYGIPYHGEDSHGDVELHVEGHGDERIFSTTNSDVFNFEGELQLNSPIFNQMSYFFRSTAYTLTEQHEEEMHDDEEHGDEEYHGEDHEEGPTLFSNDANELGFIFDINNSLYPQKLVFNLSDEVMLIAGEESFLPETKSEELTMGYYISADASALHFDLGARLDQINREAFLASGVRSFESNNASVSFNTSTAISDAIGVSLGISSLERAPSVIELYMDGPHMAAGRYEVGDPDLSPEVSRNIDLTFSMDHDDFYSTVSFFSNKVDDYIILMDQSEDDHDDHHDHDGLILGYYQQDNAVLKGYEAEIGFTTYVGDGLLDFSLGRDAIDGKFSDNNYLPRMTPSRNIINASYSSDSFEGSLIITNVEDQKDVSFMEQATDGYTLVDFHLTKDIMLSNGRSVSVSFFGKNLLDDLARNHSSFIKDHVPLPGRNLGFRVHCYF
jgi:iron complex outermembrane receptor protein